MGKVAGGLLRTLTTLFYGLCFLCAAAILVIYSYFLAKLNIHGLYIAKDWRAVEGLSGAAVLYTIFAIVLTCILGGVRFFAFFGILFDLLFMGAMIAIAVLVRRGAQTCTGNVFTPLGSGLTAASRAGTNLGTACRMNLAVLIIACIAALLFLISAVLQALVARHHQKEKKYGPGPSNNYTSGSGSKEKKSRFGRARKQDNVPGDFTRDAEMGTVGTGIVAAEPPHDRLAPATNTIRPSHDTGMTGTTMGQNENFAGTKYNNNANGYGYDNSRLDAGATVNPHNGGYTIVDPTDPEHTTRPVQF